MKKKNKVLIFIISAICFIAWIIIIRTVDVANIGPKGSSVGLSLINSSFHDLWHYDEVLGYNKFWYDFSKYVGYIDLLVVGLLGLFGLIQLIKRKSLFKVDKCILAAGVLYIITVIIYFIFEVVVVNYRPIIMPGYYYLEPSFPSSHTVLIIVVMGSVMLLAKNYITKTSIKLLVQFFCLLVIVGGVLGRFISGVHWFSDIIGGMLLSCVLLSGFSIYNQKSFGDDASGKSEQQPQKKK